MLRTGIEVLQALGEARVAPVLVLASVCVDVFVSRLFFESLEKIHHVLPLLQRPRGFRSDIGLDLLTVERLRALRVTLRRD